MSSAELPRIPPTRQRVRSQSGFSINLRRRHLNESQRAMEAQKIAALDDGASLNLGDKRGGDGFLHYLGRAKAALR